MFPGLAQSDKTSTAVAPWWHTALVLLWFLAPSGLAYRYHTLSHSHSPRLFFPFSFYLFVMANQWLTVLVIWFGIRHRGLSIGDLVSGRWPTARAFLRDLGLALGFLLVLMPFLGILGRLLRVRANLPNFLPKTASQAIVWIFVAATAGFVEECVFRGYLMQQFRAWTNSLALAVVLQGVAFGLGHGYYSSASMIFVIGTEGCLLGLLAVWRKSLRPGMLAHGIQDAGVGLLYDFVLK
jgi:membrane protease YdiL (CAAX protease family)